MTSLGRRWAGQLFGTNTGNLFVELESAGQEVRGTLWFMDSQFGLAVYEVAGTFDGISLRLGGKPQGSPEGVELGEITAEGQLTPEGSFRGDWKSSLGTAGTFVLHPHDLPAGSQETGAPREQLHIVSRTVGAVRLYADDVAELVRFVGRDFKQSKVVVTFRAHGHNEVSQYAEDFLAGGTKADRLRVLKLWAQEPEPGGIPHGVWVELNEAGDNVVRVQGTQEPWVLGTAEAVVSQLKQHEKFFVTGVRKFGLNFNGLLALGVLVALPELPFWRRIAFVGIAALLVVTITALHAKYIPNATIYLSAKRPSLAARIWPQLASGLIAVASGFIASIAYGLLKGELTLPDWIH